MPRQGDPDPVPRGRVRRSAPLATLTARTLCGRMVAGLLEHAGARGAVERFDHRAAERYARLLGRSRGVLMKVGQLLSMTDTPRWGGGALGPYLQELTHLQAAVPAMGSGLVDALLHEELGAGAENFAEFAPQPIAAASIGQVHRAVLNDGRQVAVKVQYPGVAQAIEDDLANAELLATFIRVLGAVAAVSTDPGAVVRDAAARILEEVDYRHESATIGVFGALYRDHPFIRIPRVIDEASSRRVLTMTYLDGMGWADAQQADQELKNAWAEAILRFAYSNRRLAGLLHADPSPANYRFFPDGTVGFLDFGCVQVLTDDQRRYWFAMVRAAIDGRKGDLRDLMGQAGFLDADPSLTAEELYGWWAELLGDIMADSQPVTYTPQNRERVIGSLFGFRDRRTPLARLSFPSSTVATARIQFNLVSICTALGATLQVRAIADDMDGIAEPTTTLGRQHHRWMYQRGPTPTI